MFDPRGVSIVKYDLQRYNDYIKKKLSKKRYQHSVNVAKRAEELAEIYGEDKQKAKVAGLLHDMAKEEPTEIQLQIIENSDIILNHVEILSPNLYHSMAGSVLAGSLFSIRDEDIINAIRYHTSARQNMSMLEKIIYIADLTSSDRSYNNVELISVLANKSIDEAMYLSLKFIICDLVKRELLICTDTALAYNEYCEMFAK